MVSYDDLGIVPHEPSPLYLGDSVSVEHSHSKGMLRLFLNNGNGDHTVIWLEPEVEHALWEFLSKRRPPRD